MKDDRVVLGQMEGLAYVFEGIGWEAKLLGPIKGLADVFEGIGLEDELFCDL